MLATTAQPRYTRPSEWSTKDTLNMLQDVIRRYTLVGAVQSMVCVQDRVVPAATDLGESLMRARLDFDETQKCTFSKIGTSFCCSDQDME